MPKQSEKNRPVFVARYGTVKASVWENETRKGSMFNVTVIRSYKDGDTWKDSTSFGFDDLLVLGKALNDCHSYIHEQLSQNGNSGSQQEERQEQQRR
jgi:hypothetical protein